MTQVSLEPCAPEPSFVYCCQVRVKIARLHKFYNGMNYTFNPHMENDFYNEKFYRPYNFCR